MKRIFYSLSFAVAFGFAANAATPDKIMHKAFTLQDKEVVTVTKIDKAGLTAERTTPYVRQSKQQAPVVADYVGTYNWAGFNMLGDSGAPGNGVMVITANDENPGHVIIEGFSVFCDYLDGYVDATTGNLIIPNQYMNFSSNYNEEVWFWNYTASIGEYEGEPSYMITRNNDTPFYFMINAQGNLQSGNTNQEKWESMTYTDEELKRDFCMAAAIMPDYYIENAFFWLVRGITASPLETFAFNADEWELLGNATFKDVWFPIFWDNGNTPEYDVPVYYEKANPGNYLLYDPYGKNTPYGEEVSDGQGGTFQINIATDKPGFVVFNISDNQCVTVEPYVYALTLDMREDPLDPVLPVEIYPLNTEGYLYYVLGESKEDIIVDFFLEDLNMSNFDERSREVTIYNPMFAIGSNLTEYLGWKDYNDMSAGYIKLPNNWQDSVGNILGEENNAEPVYYNLQGVKLSNPEKGQIVIVRKGNVTTKQVIR